MRFSDRKLSWILRHSLVFSKLMDLENVAFFKLFFSQKLTMLVKVFFIYIKHALVGKK